MHNLMRINSFLRRVLVLHGIVMKIIIKLVVIIKIIILVIIIKILIVIINKIT
jgi:hypothetical protein